MERSDFPVLTPEEAAALIPDDALVAFSGFTPAGAAKVVPRAIAKQAEAIHQKGDPYAIRVLTGASTGGYLNRRRDRCSPGRGQRRQMARPLSTLEGP